MKDINLTFKIILNFIRSKKLIAVVFIAAALLFGVSFLSLLGGFISFFSDVNSADYMKCRHVVTFRYELSAEDADTYCNNRLFLKKRDTELNAVAAVSNEEKYYVTTFYGESDSILYYICRDGRLFFTKDELSGKDPAVFVMSVDSEAKIISLIELIGCSRAKGPALLIAAFGLTLLPGIIINTVLLLVANIGAGQMITNIWITWESFVQLAAAVLAFMIIITAVSLLMMQKKSYTQRKIEEM